MKTLQPYRKFEIYFLGQLSKQGSFYLVSQTYERGQDAHDHSKVAVLFTPYKEVKDASLHFNAVRSDKNAGFVDIRKKKVMAHISNICYGHSHVVPYISFVENGENINRYIDKHYYQQIRTYIRKHQPKWNISQHNSLQPHFETVMGEPMVNIKW